MKYLWIIFLFFTPLAQSKYCIDGSAIYAVLETEKIELLELPKIFSEHIGDFKNIAAKSPSKKIEELKISSINVKLKKDKEGVFTENFNFFEFLEKHKIHGSFRVDFEFSDGETCYREYEVLYGE